jgi:hypothetical protein
MGTPNEGSDIGWTSRGSAPTKHHRGAGGLACQLTGWPSGPCTQIRALLDVPQSPASLAMLPDSDQLASLPRIPHEQLYAIAGEVQQQVSFFDQPVVKISLGDLVVSVPSALSGADTDRAKTIPCGYLDQNGWHVTCHHLDMTGNSAFVDAVVAEIGRTIKARR